MTTDTTRKDDDDRDRDLTNRSDEPMRSVIQNEAPTTEPTTETTHEQTTATPQGVGRTRTGVVRRIIVILLLIAPVAAAIPRMAP